MERVAIQDTFELESTQGTKECGFIMRVSSFRIILQVPCSWGKFCERSIERTSPLVHLNIEEETIARRRSRIGVQKNARAYPVNREACTRAKAADSAVSTTESGKERNRSTTDLTAK